MPRGGDPGAAGKGGKSREVMLSSKLLAALPTRT